MNSENRLLAAICAENIEALKSLHTSNVNFNSLVDGVLPLCLAARLGKENVVKFMLEIKVDVNAFSEDFSVEDEIDDGSEVPWIHFEPDVMHQYFNSSSQGFHRTSCSSKPSISALNLAAKVGHAAIVRLLCMHGADVNTVDQYKRTPLMHASHQGSLEVIHILFEYGANIHATDFQQRTVVFYATHGGHNSVLKLMVDKGAPVNATDIWGQNVLHAVTWTDHVHTAEFLLSLGCDCRKEDKGKIIPALLAVKICSAAVLKCLLIHDPQFHSKWHDAESGSSLLHVAVVEENNFGAKITKYLIDASVDINKVNATGETAACLAIGHNNLEALSLLVEAGCDLNIPTRSQKQPLHIVIESPRVKKEAVEMLIRGGANINQRDNCDRTPLTLAIVYKQSDKALELIRLGCEIETQDIEGMTPLHLAIRQHLNRVAFALISKGTSINAQERFGWTPLHIAVDTGNVAMVKKLISEGCNLNNSETMDRRTPLGLAVHHNQTPNMEYIIKALYLAGGINGHVCIKSTRMATASHKCLQILRPLFPLSLRTTCRVAVRRHLFGNTIQAINQLPLPSRLKEFLLSDALL